MCSVDVMPGNHYTLCAQSFECQEIIFSIYMWNELYSFIFHLKVTNDFFVVIWIVPSVCWFSGPHTSSWRPQWSWVCCVPRQMSLIAGSLPLAQYEQREWYLFACVAVGIEYEMIFSQLGLMAFYNYITNWTKTKWPLFWKPHFQMHFPQWQSFNPIEFLLKFVLKDLMDSDPSLVSIMAWR